MNFPQSTGHGPREFNSTHWSLILAAGGNSSSDAREALEELCRNYWPPLYAYVRRQGYGPEEAQDLTQAFFLQLLEQDALTTVDPRKGLFRSFLLRSIKNLLTNEWHRSHTQKRGGGTLTFSLDQQRGEASYEAALAESLTPDKLFDRRWAETLLERVLLRLREDWNARDKLQRFDELKGLLVARRGETPFTEVAARLRITVPALRSLMHRLREAYREIITEEIAHTVTSPAEVEAEIRYLLTVLNDE